MIPRNYRFWLLCGVGVLWLILISLSIFIKTRGSWQGTHTQLITGVIVVLLGSAVIAVVISSFVRPAARRRRLLRADNPEALVANIRRDQTLLDALNELGVQQPEKSDPAYIPLFPTLLVDKSRLVLYAGSAEPIVILDIGWDRIEDISSETVYSYQFPTAVVAFTVSNVGDVVKLPFIVSGEILGGLYPLSTPGLDRFVDQLRALEPSR
jgi:hypothetical protein